MLNVGASPRSDIYLFNDPGVASQHAVICTAGDTYELESVSRDQRVVLNGRPVQRTRLRHGDRVTIGRTSFLFQNRRGN
jgi:pSer/pThr/pTyr-binding forkhead associated (FHA) protein